MTASTARPAIARLLAAGLAASIATHAHAQNSVAINLTGMVISNGGNQTRSSAPATISPDFVYTYVIDGMVRGQGGVLGLTFPSPTPLAQVLETLSPGSSEALTGAITNCPGTHPLVQPPITQSGTQQIGFVNVTYAATLQAQINADNTAQFSITNIVLQPSALVGSLVFTSGTTTITRTNACPANCDGSTTSPVLTPADFVCFLNKYRSADPAANCDCSTTEPTLTPADFVCFLNKFRAGCP